MSDMIDTSDTSDNNTPYLREARANALRYRLGLLTEQDLADAFGLRSTSTLATWRSEGKGPPFVKLGKSVFYIQNDVDEWIVRSANAKAA